MPSKNKPSLFTDFLHEDEVMKVSRPRPESAGRA